MKFFKKRNDDYELARHSSSVRYTFIVTSNSEAKTRKFTISSFWLNHLLICLCIVIIAAVFVMASYVNLLSAYEKTKEDLVTLQSINSNQQLQLYDMTELAKDVEEKLIYLDLLETKVQTIINESSINLSTEDEILVAEIDSKLEQMRDTMAVGGKSNYSGLNYYVANASAEELNITSELEIIKNSLSHIDVDVSKESVNYSDLAQDVEEYDRLTNRTPHHNPLPAGSYRISQYFEYRVYPRVEFHSGMDLAAPSGTEIQPVAKGTVIYSGWIDEYGYTVRIDHGNGYESLYAHMSGVNCYVGEEVTVDDTIGYVGTTGYSTGNHLHLEIRVDGVRVDPCDYIDF